MYLSRHAAPEDTSGPVETTGPVSRFRRDIIWSVALVLSLALGGGGIAVAAATGDQVMCPPGVSLEVRPDGTWRCLPSPSGSPSPSSSPTTSPTPSPTVAPTPSSSPTPTSTPPAPPGFPTATTAGVPQGWVPTTTRGTWTITTPGLYEDVRVNGSILIRTTAVVLRRVQVVGGIVKNEASGRCYAFTIEDSSIVQPPGSYTNAGGDGVLGPGGYTARRVAIIDRVEGFRVGGKSSGCGPVSIEDSYARVTPPRPCGDWHGDGVQGYDAPPATFRNVTLDLVEDGCGGTAPFFYSAAGNSPLVVDRMLVSGGGYAFRMDTSGQVTGLRVVDGTWSYGPIEYDTTCSRATVWQDNAISDPLGNALRPITC